MIELKEAAWCYHTLRGTPRTVHLGKALSCFSTQGLEKKNGVIFGLKIFACLWEQINFQLVEVNEERQEQ